MNPTPIQKAKQLLGPLVSHPKAVRCVFEEHEDKHKSATLYPDGFHCHGCGRGLDTFAYYCFIHNLTTRQALTKLGVLSGSFKPPPPTPKAIQDFAEHFADKLKDSPEARLAHSWAQDIKRLNIPEEATLANLTSKEFLNACRNKGLNPLLIHDLIFMEVA